MQEEAIPKKEDELDSANTRNQKYAKAHRQASTYILQKFSGLKEDIYKNNRSLMKTYEQPRPPTNQIQIDRVICQIFKKTQSSGFKSGSSQKERQIRNIDCSDQDFPKNTYNQYSLFFPFTFTAVNKDEYCSTFPILQHYEIILENESQNRVLDDITETIKKAKSQGRVRIGWQMCLNKYIWGADFQEILHALMSIRYSDWNYLKYYMSCKLNQEAITLEVIKYSIQQMCNKMEIRTKMKKNLPVSIETSDPINEFTIVKTSKYLFCGSCLKYDCERHRLDDSLLNRSIMYCHPSNYIDSKKHKKYAAMVLDSYKRLFQSFYSANTNIDTLHNKPCSNDCFRNLTLEKFEFIKLKRYCLISEMIQAQINRGVQIFSFDPCMVYAFVKSKLTCSLVFLYFTQSFNLQTRLEYGLRLTKQEHIADPFPEEQYFPRSKKNVRKQKKDYQGGHEGHLYTISNCYHKFFGEQKLIDRHCEECSCKERGFCVPLCHCNPQLCSIRLIGCECKGQSECKTNNCPCFQAQRECDPHICLNCVETHLRPKINKCRNNEIQIQSFSQVRIGKSKLTGLGAFAAENISKNSLINLYEGELINSATENLREAISDNHFFYNFGFRGMAIDAKYLGNQMRFLNHEGNGTENVVAKIVFSRTDYYLGFYAIKDIAEGQEMMVDYDGKGQLFKMHHDKYPFIKSKKK